MIFSTDDLKEKDWVILRLLYYILSTDPSAVTVRDITKTLEWRDRRISTATVLKAFALIEREYTEHRVRDQTGSRAMREVQMKWRQDVPPWPEPPIEEQVNIVLAKARGVDLGKG